MCEKKHEEKQQRSRFGLSFQVSIEEEHFIFALSSVDWLDISFAIHARVDLIADEYSILEISVRNDGSHAKS